MPAFVRTEKDEARWADAKKQAAKEGKANNYAYITSIYKEMSKSLELNKGNPPSASQSPLLFGIGSTFAHGQVPHITVTKKPSLAADVDPEKMPTPKTALELKLPLGPFNSAKDAVHGMGMPLHAEQGWATAFERTAQQSDNELRFKQNLMGKLLETFADDGATRREMYQRGLAYYRGLDRPKESAALTLKAKKKESSPLGSRGLTREARASSSRGGHKLQLHGRKDPVLEVQQQTKRALPAGSVRVHYSAEHKGYVEAMKRADGTWKVLGSAHDKKDKKPKEKHDHSKPKLTVHHDEHHRGSHEPHHHAEDEHDSARAHVATMKASVPNLQKAKYDHIDFKPPKSVADAAAQGLEYRKKASPSNRGGLTAEEAGKQGIGSGVQRATNLKNGHTMSPKTVRMMSQFFSRHEKNKAINPKFKGTPWNDKGYVAWLLWGGDAGQAWANKVVNQMNAADKKTSKMMTPAGPITTLYRSEKRKGPFADEKNKKYPIDDYEHTRAAISYFSMPKNAKKYAPAERSAIWNRIKAAAKKFNIELGPEAGPPSLEAKKSNQSKETDMERNEVFKAIMDRDVEVMRPNDYRSEYTGMDEAVLSEVKTEVINPAATAAGAEEGNPETESPLTPAQGSGDGGGLGGATDDDSPGILDHAMTKGHPNHLQAISVTEDNGTWNQGEDSRVTYSSNEDAFIAAAMEKSDNLCVAPEPSVRYSTVMGARTSPCGHQFAKALTVCPSCGTDASGFSGQVQGLSISKSVKTRLEGPAQLPDIHLAD